MIKLIEIHIEEFRGIKKLTLKPDGQNFVVHGPNGSGKSGVVDAIDFGLSGNISRLSGKGTGDISLKKHGPHVDATPKKAKVRLTLYFPSIRKTAQIERSLSDPRNLLITPIGKKTDEKEIRGLLEQVAQHSEMTLSRREIIKYILSESKKRSEDVQTLLKLDELGQLRATFKTAANQLDKERKNADKNHTAAKEDLKTHLDVQQLNSISILEKVNHKRKTLNLDVLGDITKETNVASGLIKSEKTSTFSRATALKDLSNLKERLNAPEGKQSLDKCIIKFDDLKKNPTLLKQLKLISFYEKGIELIDDEHESCPLCDAEWDFEALLSHLRNKLEKVKKIREIGNELNNSTSKLHSYLQRLITLLQRAHKISQDVHLEQESSIISAWIERLNFITPKLQSNDISSLLETENQIRQLWTQEPFTSCNAITATYKAEEAKPDDSTEKEAEKFLIIAQERLTKCRATNRILERKKEAATKAEIALNLYNETVEDTLDVLYKQVESKLSDLYRFINSDDEIEFKAKLEHKESKLNLSVDFHNRGLFPPGAYHSEGHQDGMGLCLYLALMEQLLKNEFSFAVLDDVVMSVDASHRREVCRLFREKFPDTQFIITTHEQVWYRQMISQKLIPGKASSVSFRNWTVDEGPQVSNSPEVWDEINKALDQDDIPVAAAKLRRHLEYVAHELAELLRAQVTFQGDASYDLGSLLPAALSRVKKYFKDAKKAANSWGHADRLSQIETLEKNFSEKVNASAMEQWAINPAVHYNEWANFTKDDFVPVVRSYEELLNQIRCEKCEHWLYASGPRGNAEALRCNCGEINLNLRKK